MYVQCCGGSTKVVRRHCKKHKEEWKLVSDVYSKCIAKPKLVQTSMLTFLTPKAKPLTPEVQKKCEMYLVGFMMETMLPFSALDSENLIALFRESGSSFVIPGPKKIANVTIPRVRKDILNSFVAPTLRDVKYICISSDGFKAVNRNKYYTVNAHAINPTTADPVTANLATASIPSGQTECADDIAQCIKNLLDAVDDELNKDDKFVSKVLHAVTDRASNMLGAVRVLLLTCNFCNVHMLSTALKTAVSKSAFIVGLFKTVNGIIIRVRNVTQLRHELFRLQLADSSCQTVLELIPECDTRFVTKAVVLQRFVTLKQAIIGLMPLLPSDLQLKAGHWLVLEHLVVIFAQFLQATEILSGTTYPTLPLVVPFIEHIQLVIEDCLQSLPQVRLPADFRMSLQQFDKGLLSYLRYFWNYEKMRTIRNEDETSRRLTNQLVAVMLHPALKDLDFFGHEFHPRAVAALTTMVESNLYARSQSVSEEATMQSLPGVGAQATAKQGWFESKRRRRSVPADSDRQSDKQAAEQAVKRYIDATVKIDDYVPEHTAAENVFKCFNIPKCWRDLKADHALIFEVRSVALFVHSSSWLDFILSIMFIFQCPPTFIRVLALQ